MLTANLLAIVAELLRDLELEARLTVELVVLPELVAALHSVEGSIESTSWDHTPELRQLAEQLVAELGLDANHVASVRLSATTGLVAELRWPQPVRLEVF